MGVIEAKFCAGVDAGGSGTRAVVRAQDGATFEGRAGPANPGRVGYAGCLAAIAVAVSDALAHDSGARPLGQVSVHAGIAGLGRAHDLEALRREPHPFGAFSFESDASLTLRAAFPDGPGCVLMVGTGCVSFRRDATGSVHRAGGWGFPVELGGGAWLGLEVLRHALSAFEAGSPGLLSDLIAARIGPLENAPAWVREAGPSDFAALAPLGLLAAKGGDAQAAAVLREWGANLADLLARVHAPSFVGPWAAWGGLSEAALTVLPTALLANRRDMTRSPLETAVDTARQAGR